MAKHCKKTLDKNNKKNKSKDSSFGWSGPDGVYKDPKDLPGSDSKSYVKQKDVPYGNQVDPAQVALSNPSSDFVAIQSAPKSNNVLLKLLCVFVGILFAAYIAGFVLFSFFLAYPNSSVFNNDISLMSKTAVAEVLKDAHKDYDLNIKGSGLDFVITNEQANLEIDVNKSTEDIINSQAMAFDWPVQIMHSHVLDDYVSTTLKRHTLESLIEDQVSAFNETAAAPINAYVAYSPEKNSFEVVPDVIGTMLNATAICEDAEISMLKNETLLNIDDSYLLPAEVLADDANLNKSLAPANELLKGNVSIIHDGVSVGSITSADVATWIIFPGDGTAILDDSMLSQGVDAIVKGFDSVGTERTYTRPDGKVITVSGGVYGWSVDSQGLYDQIYEAILGTEDVSIEPHFNSVAANLVPTGEQDWGSYYIDVDLEEQYARFYDGENIIWETDIISGKPSSPTPQGVWAVTGMQSPSILVGAPLPGEEEPEYRTKVEYWMPFQGNAVGFHDATWQPSYGGSMYVEGYGSHGCVNISYEAAEELYSILEVDVPVVVHG